MFKVREKKKEKEIPESLKNVFRWLLQESQEGRFEFLTKPRTGVVA